MTDPKFGITVEEATAGVPAMIDAMKAFGIATMAIGFTGLGRSAQEERLALEHATVNLILVTQPEDKADVLAEVARRTELMGERAAYESVYGDVAAGRWPR